ncbi:MAG TPA: FAD-dependent oxidoreductase [Kofleriaceae bacterium]|nr:FAD-dependent oxidoreductase [Kofleriaceae bacterium]
MSAAAPPPSRRDALRALLGAPAVAAAMSAGGCGARGRPPLPDGALVGGAERLGHRVRDQGAPPVPPADRWSRVGVVIAGGGVAGLAAAWRLARAGMRDFAVLELDAAAGGTAQSGRSPVTAYPWGAHYIVAPLAHERALIALLREMGAIEGEDRDGHPVVAEELRCREPEERIYQHGRWYEGLYLTAGETAEDRAERAAFQREIDRWVGWRDGRGRRAFALPVSAGSDDAEVTALDRMTMAEWMDRRGLRSARLRWLIDYACRDDYGMRPAETSAWAGLLYFASRVRAPGADSQSVVTWPEGNGRLVAQLARAAEGRVRLGVAVCDVVPRGAGAVGAGGAAGARGAGGAGGADVVAIDGSGQPFGVHADQVIFAAPQMIARRVVRPLRDREPSHSSEFEYGAWMVANLHLEGRLREPDGGYPLAWDNVFYRSPSLGYVVATHQSGSDHGDTVLTYYYPLADQAPAAARRHLLGASRDDWAEVILTDLGRAHRDVRERVRRLDVMRWGHAMVRPRPGFAWGGARQAAARPIGSIHFAHSDLSGVALFEEALDQGVRAAEEVLAARGIASESLR